MVKLNHKRRKKMRRKIQRRDVGWESVITSVKFMILCKLLCMK